MQFRNKFINRDRDLVLNVTSLVDIILVLLIFFMVTANLNQLTNLSIQLPKVEKSYIEDSAVALNLTITADGSYILNKETLTTSNKRTLTTAIFNLVAKKRDVPFVITGDSNAPYQAIVTALDTAGELGFSNVRFAAVKDS